jgi:hypothetical protein
MEWRVSLLRQARWILMAAVPGRIRNVYRHAVLAFYCDVEQL